MTAMRSRTGHVEEGNVLQFQLIPMALLVLLSASMTRAQDGSAPRAHKTDELTTHGEPRPLSAGAITHDWPGLLGPGQNGHCTETPLRTDFEADPPSLLWTYDTGNGYAAPAIADGKLVLAHRDGSGMHLDCLDAETGMRYWRHTHPCDFRGEYISDNGPRAAPVIADGKVFFHSVGGPLFCLDLSDGSVIWHRNPTEEFNVPDQFFGVVPSLLVLNNMLIQNVGGANMGASVVAFDTQTGNVIWKAGSKWGPSCASPVAGMLHGKEHVFVVTGGKTRPPTGGLLVIDPSDGRVVLEHPFRSRTFESVNGSNPVVVEEGAVYLTASYGVGTARVNIASDGTFEQVWKNRRVGVQFSTPLVVGGYLYLIDGRSDRAGAMVCLDLTTGAERSRTDIVWDEELLYNGELQTVPMSIGEGSMLYVEGRALVLGDNGHLLWVDLDPAGARVTGRVSLFRANETWTPPAISHGLLYVCQNRRERFGNDRQPARLLCFDLRKSDSDG